MNKVKKTKAKNYRDSKIPAQLFFEIMESQDLKKLIYEPYGENNTVAPKEKQLSKDWANIFDEYFELVNDPKHRLVLKIKIKIVSLYRKISMIEIILKEIAIRPFTNEQKQNLFSQFKKLGIYIDVDKPIKEEIIRILKIDLEGFKTRFQIEKSNLDEITKGEISTFEENIVALERALGKDYLPDTITLRRYATYIKQAKKIK